MKSRIVLVIDVESIGLHGQGYAVGAVLLNGREEISAFRYACPPGNANGSDFDRKWVSENIPEIPCTHDAPFGVEEAFWGQWERIKKAHPDAVMAAECGWPVEANFLEACIQNDEPNRRFAGPYPLHEIASFMEAAGMDPMASYPYEAGEQKHDPLADARQSSRLLLEALRRIL